MQPAQHTQKQLCNAEAHTEGRGQDGVVEYASAQTCSLVYNNLHVLIFLCTSVTHAYMCTFVCVCVGGSPHWLQAPTAWSDLV